MSAVEWLASIAGLWLVFLACRWRWDVFHQRRSRARELGHKAAGRLPRYAAPWRRLVLIGLWIAAVYAAAPNRTAWLLAGFPLASWAVLVWAARWSLKHGHYSAASRLAGALLWVAPDSAALLRRRGEILLAAGRLPEAEDWLRKALAQGYREGQQVRALECLGRVLTAQGQYAEAARAIEVALKVMPRRSGLHAALADALLWQAAKPEEALALVKRALDYEGKARQPSGPNSFAAAWAAEAWAFGLLGHRDAMLQAVRHALGAIDESESWQAAGVYLRLGMALRSAGEEEAAVKSFEDACATDRAGLYGKLAAQALGRESA
jgi:tetratricopeptide (TPR) repeat protein